MHTKTSVKYIILSKKWLIVSFVLIFVLVASFIGGSVIAASIPRSQFTVLLDAGHGGRDGGCVGSGGSIEKELNLSYTLAIKSILEDSGINVILTRKRDVALYSPFSKNKKIDDMRKRVSIINASKPDLYLSIHMNSTPYTYRRGATIYSAKHSASSGRLAEILAKTFAAQLEYASPTPKTGDYYILNEPSAVGALIEVGFLSNTHDEALLSTDAHRQKVAYATFCSILLFLGVRL